MNIINLLTDATVATNSGFFNILIELVKTYWPQIAAIISSPILITYISKILFILIKGKVSSKSIIKLDKTVSEVPNTIKDILEANTNTLINERVKYLESELKLTQDTLLAFIEVILNTKDNAELKALFYEKLHEMNLIKADVEEEKITENNENTKVEEVIVNETAKENKFEEGSTISLE